MKKLELQDNQSERVAKLKKAKVAFDLLQELKKDLRMQGILFLEIGRILKTFRDEKLYSVLGDGGYDTWTSFLGSGELSLKSSTVYAYIEIYELFVVRFGFVVEELAEIPYDKLRLSLPSARKLTTKAEVEELVLKAKELSRSDLLKEFGQMTEEGKPIGWVKSVKLVTCEVCGKWKVADEKLDFCDCKH